MIKDVKSYFNTVGNRLTKAFSMDDFTTEQELEFWSLSAEHVSRTSSPNFVDIVKWIDLLYQAPVHIVYQKKDEELFLFKRHINLRNVLRRESDDETKLTKEEQEKYQEFEQRVQNLQLKKKWYDEYTEYGISSHSIGNCEHIPIFTKEGEIWGIYVVGPDRKCPDEMAPKLSIVGRILSMWLIDIEKEESGQKDKNKHKVLDIVSELGSGALNTEGISKLYLNYALHKIGNNRGGVFAFKDGEITPIYLQGVEEPELIEFLSLKDTYIQKGNKIPLIQSIDLSVFGKVSILPFDTETPAGFTLIIQDKDSNINWNSIKPVTDELSEILSKLVEFETTNKLFSTELTESYFRLLRFHEQQREKTRYHTLRVISFADKFADYFGLDGKEKEELLLTARLHDIGYVGNISSESSKDVNTELMHPMAGFKLIDQLPVPDIVKQGVLTHHEWVNGDGEPQGLESDDIPWSGKIIGIIEYVVDFIESALIVDSTDTDKVFDELKSGIIQRADKQFDMVLVPTIIEMLSLYGWDNFTKFGTEE
jgi:response regulator RpfG family c-di-GMP phosphodiesterase